MCRIRLKKDKSQMLRPRGKPNHCPRIPFCGSTLQPVLAGLPFFPNSYGRQGVGLLLSVPTVADCLNTHAWQWHARPPEKAFWDLLTLQKKCRACRSRKSHDLVPEERGRGAANYLLGTPNRYRRDIPVIAAVGLHHLLTNVEITFSFFIH